MVFDALMLTCLIHETSFRESGNTISVQRQSGETVIFFVLDDQSNPRSSVRSDVGISGELCDCLIFYSHNTEITLCLVESKGADVEKAIAQITNTKRHLEAAISATTKGKQCKSSANRLRWKGYILARGGSPQEKEKVNEEARKFFHRGNFLMSSNGNIGPFLRSD